MSLSFGPRQAAAEFSGHTDPVARPGSAASDQPLFMSFADRSHADDERSVPRRRVSADDSDVEFRGSLQHAGHQLIGERVSVRRLATRQAHCDHGIAWRRGHRGQVAQVDVDRLSPHLPGRRGRAAKVDSFQQHVRRDDGRSPGFKRHGRRVVADAKADSGELASLLTDSVDELKLGRFVRKHGRVESCGASVESSR